MVGSGKYFNRTAATLVGGLLLAAITPAALHRLGVSNLGPVAAGFDVLSALAWALSALAPRASKTCACLSFVAAAFALVASACMLG